jgi:hypothetical protein
VARIIHTSRDDDDMTLIQIKMQATQMLGMLAR